MVDMSTPSLSGPATSRPEVLRRMVLGYRVSRAIHVAAVLGIADLLADGPWGVDDLAAETGTHGPSLYRLLRLLASEGIFTEVAPRRFGLTPLAELLRADVPGSQHALAVWDGTACVWDAWGNVLHALRTGQSAFEHTFGQPHFAYLAEHPDKAAAFDAYMVEQTSRASRAILDAYDFSGLSTIVDVGGGRGALLAAILSAYPAANGILFDQPAVVAEASALLAQAGVADRCQVVGGDFFVAVPDGGDVYLLRLVLHDWDDERCVAILRTCRRAMAPEARLLVVEPLLPPGDEPSYGKYQDIQMLVMLPGGRERTEDEHRALLDAAGFRLTRVVPIASELSVVEATPVN
jgi:hypothetical protein